MPGLPLLAIDIIWLQRYYQASEEWNDGPRRITQFPAVAQFLLAESDFIIGQPDKMVAMSMATELSDEVDVLVIGAGQAGLAMARALNPLDVTYVVHERHARIGDSWRERFDSLMLFTPRELSALPGLPHHGDPRGLPGKDEMGAYLERYAEHYTLPVITGRSVARLSRSPRGFVAETESGTVTKAKAVVIATGGFQRPRLPPFAQALAPHVQQLDAQSYRSPAALAKDGVIVVGDGASGRQIALEVARHRKVTLSTGRTRFFGPQRILGKDTTELALRAGLLTAGGQTLVGRVVRRLDVTPGLYLRSGALRRVGIELVPRCVDAKGDRLVFADGSERHAGVVIWALGYRDETTWLDIKHAAAPDKFLHHHGVAPVPGLFHVGREWQTSRASGLICGVHRDAELIAAHLKDYLRSYDS